MPRTMAGTKAVAFAGRGLVSPALLFMLVLFGFAVAARAQAGYTATRAGDLQVVALPMPAPISDYRLIFGAVRSMLRSTSNRTTVLKSTFTS